MALIRIRRNRKSSDFFYERGVEMVEMALILPVLILICFGVVDLLRISYFESMLQRTAADIAVQARTAPNLDYDLREFTTNSGEYYDFKEARKRAVENGLASSSNSFTPPGTPSDAQLIATSQLDNSLANYAGPDPAPFASSAVILRPGEEATFSYVDDYGATQTQTVKHPLIPSDATGKVPPQKMAALLDLSPVHVEIRALVHPLLYFALGTRIVRGVATTYREKGIRRTPMLDASGGDTIKPSTATRRTGTGEVWLTSPEPVEPPPVPVYDWPRAFNASAFSGTVQCAKPISDFDTQDCPPGL